MTPTAIFLRFVRPYIRRLSVSLTLTIVGTIIALIPPLIIKVIVDECIGEGKWQWFPLAILAGFTIPFLRAGVTFFNRYMLIGISQRIILDIRMAMYRHLQKLSLNYFAGTTTGAITERLMSDVNTVRNIVTGTTIRMANDIMQCGLGLVFMFWLNWRMTLLALLVVPLYILNFKIFIRYIREANAKYRLKMDEVASILQERIDGTTTVKVYNREEAESERFVEDTEETYTLARRGHVLSTSFNRTSFAITGLNWIVVYCIGASMVVAGQMSYGEVLAFCAYAQGLVQPAIRFSELVNQFQDTLVSMERIGEVLGADPAIKDSDNPVRLADPEGDIRFENVTFAYKEGQPVLHNIDLHIPAGKTVAFVGHTGCGKTTLATLLYRFYDVSEGRITLDGHDLRDIRLRDLRRHIGIVLQDSILFNDTIYNNIAFGKPEATMEEVVEASRIAEIHKVVETFPDGYETLIGEDGIKLTSGQKQRLAIARAILKDPSVLILDEATSSLDSESERLIQRALERVMSQRTTIVIAHRLSTIESADCIVVIDDGRIVETGTHDELLKHVGGAYYTLYHKQFEGAA